MKCLFCATNFPNVQQGQLSELDMFRVMDTTMSGGYNSMQVQVSPHCEKMFFCTPRCWTSFVGRHPSTVPWSAVSAYYERNSTKAGRLLAMRSYRNPPKDQLKEQQTTEPEEQEVLRVA